MQGWPNNLEWRTKVLGPDAASDWRVTELRQLLDRAGSILGPKASRASDDASAASAADGGRDDLFVTAIELFDALAHLRSALRAVELWQSGRESEVESTLRASFSSLYDDITTSIAAAKVPEAVRPHVRLKQWLVFELQAQRFETVVFLEGLNEPARISFRPTSAVQLLWLTLAVTARALDPPFATGGFYRCDYCNETFVADRSHARGTHIFCSPEHGRNFHARQSMRKKRAAARAAREADGKPSRDRKAP